MRLLRGYELPPLELVVSLLVFAGVLVRFVQLVRAHNADSRLDWLASRTGVDGWTPPDVRKREILAALAALMVASVVLGAFLWHALDEK